MISELHNSGLKGFLDMGNRKFCYMFRRIREICKFSNINRDPSSQNNPSHPLKDERRLKQHKKIQHSFFIIKIFLQTRTYNISDISHLYDTYTGWVFDFYLYVDLENNLGFLKSKETLHTFIIFPIRLKWEDIPVLSFHNELGSYLILSIKELVRYNIQTLQMRNENTFFWFHLVK